MDPIFNNCLFWSSKFLS